LGCSSVVEHCLACSKPLFWSPALWGTF
jgi:hypothetical protein